MSPQELEEVRRVVRETLHDETKPKMEFERNIQFRCWDIFVEMPPAKADGNRRWAIVRWADRDPKPIIVRRGLFDPDGRSIEEEVE